MAATDTDPTDFEARIEATDRLLRAHKFRYTNLMVKVQAGDDDAAELAALGMLEQILKLEVRLENLRAFIRVRDLTREPAIAYVSEGKL